MPNWCNNNVIVSAKTEAELVEFLDFCEQTHTSNHIDWKTNEPVKDTNAKGVFWNFVTPTDLVEYFEGSTMSKASIGETMLADIAQEISTGMDWYHWNVREWGTKWDITLERDEIVIDQSNDGNYYFHWYFDTAWSPAQEAYNAMAKKFPNLDFDFEITEEANFYAGKLHYAGGELVSEEWIDLPNHHDFVDVLDIPCPECGWSDTGNCLDNQDEDVLELESLTTTQSGE
jgi:hypothetical protein